MYNFESRIDTLQTKEPITNRHGEIIDMKGVVHTSNAKDNLYTKINPNNFDYDYSDVYALSTTNASIINIFNTLNIIDTSAVKFKRIDIATDSDMKFDEHVNLLDLIHKCIRAKNKNGLAWSNLAEDTLNISNFYFNQKNNIQIEFYNKKKESHGKAKYNTRMELRLLRISSQDPTFHVHHAISLWKAMPNNLEQVENEITRILKDKWISESSISPGLKFSTFVYKWSHYIYTRKVLDNLYKETHLKCSLSYWLSEYRKKHYINFYKKKDLTSISQSVVKSLKNYIEK